jgi:tetratricopeptide (TPR) repeat protein
MALKQHNDDILIAQVDPPSKTDGGDYFYRTHAPGVAMAQEDEVYVVNLTSQHRQGHDIMSQADVLILNDVCDADLLPLIHERKRHKRLTVYEIGDDLTALEPWNPVYFFYQDPENVALSLKLAETCDALQVTVPGLERIFGHLNAECRIFPNQILYAPEERKPKKHKEFVVGWGGSHGHLEDMADIADPLIRWIMSKSDAMLHLMCSEPIWALFDRLPKNKKKWIRPGSIEDYYKFLEGIDIGIAPIKDTAFNRSKSDVKFLEYAVSGIVPVVARLEPYIDSVQEGETGFTYQDPKGLIAVLHRLFEDRNLLRHISETARKYVLNERMHMAHGGDRIDFYRSRLTDRFEADRTSDRAWERFGKWCRLEGAVQTGKHLRLMPSQFESLLYNGLVTSQVSGQMAHARQLFESAARLAPEHYQTYLFGSTAAGNPVEYLLKAVGRNPNSIKAWLLLGEEMAGSGKIKEAFESFDTAVRICPDYDLPYLRASVLLEKIGQTKQAEVLYSKAKSLAVRHPMKPVAM